MQKFNVGDIVKVKSTGNHYTVVSEAGSWYPICEPVPTNYGLKRVIPNSRRELAKDNLVFVGKASEYKEKLKKEKEMNTLYEFKVMGVTHYGTRLAVNSAGKWVMEVKGQDLPTVVDKNDCEKVVPYTIKVVSLTGSSNPCHAVVEKGKYRVGQLFLTNNGIVKVVQLDTGVEGAKDFKPQAEVLTKEV